MREVLPELLRWWREGATVGMATVVATFRSAPCPPGASMLVGPTGEAVGSVSGGCVEGAVYELSQSVVASGRPVLSATASATTTPFAVGLTCGGILDVFVEAVDPQSFPELGEVAEDIEAGRPVAVATVVEHPDPERVGGGSSCGRAAPARPTSGSLGSERSDARRRRRRAGPARERPQRDARPTARTASAAARACGSSSRCSPRRRG